jgi:hypothetical protein
VGNGEFVPIARNMRKTPRTERYVANLFFLWKTKARKLKVGIAKLAKTQNAFRG